MGKTTGSAVNVNAIALKVVQLKHEAMEAGLYETGRALEVAVKAVGWELAKKLGKIDKQRDEVLNGANNQEDF